MKKNILITFLVVVLGLFYSINNAFAAVTWVSTSPLPPAYIGVPYSHQLQATSAPPAPITYTIIAGSIPGLSLSSSGLISGTVSSTGTQSVTIQASDGFVAAPVPRSFSISYLSTGITGSLRIKRLQIYFANKRPEITVTKNQKAPKAYADFSYIGSGLLKGYWSVDGVIHSQIYRTLTSGDNLVLPLSELPPLPVYQTGSHRVQLVITEPNLGTVPEIIYFVAENEAEVFEPIKVIFPPDRLEVVYAPLSFTWTLQKNTSAYLVEFRVKEDEKPFFSAYTREASYTLPAHSLQEYFSAKKTYVWGIKGVSADDSIINESKLHHFTFE